MLREVGISWFAVCWLHCGVARGGRDCAAFLGRSFTGMGPTPTRTSFASRLPGTADGDGQRFQFFYATNRNATDAETFRARGSKLGTEVSTGTLDVLRAPGTRIEPWEWFDIRSIKWGKR